MNPLAILSAIGPYLMQMFNLGNAIVAATKTGTSVISLLEQFGPDVLTILKGVGTKLFPNLATEHQVQAAAQITYDTQTTTFIQDALNKLGASPALTVDGIYGQATKTAVTAWQTKNKVDPADGWAGPVTQAALHTAINAIGAPLTQVAAPALAPAT